MKFTSKPIAIIIIATLIIISSSAYLIFFSGNKIEDKTPPTITSITGNTTGTPGKITTIQVNFSDNVNVTKATIYYKPATALKWNNASILNKSYDIEIPSKNPIENWYYYVTVDDAAGNGPVGDPSIDGSLYYIITVTESKKNLVHNVFIEEGTATWCHNCPVVAEILHELYESGKYNFYYVAMVGDKNQKANSRLKNDYNIYAYPTVYIDGGYQVITGGDKPKSTYKEGILKAQRRDVPEIHVEITAELTENKKETKIYVTIKNYENTTYKGNLKVYLTEKVSCQRHDGGTYYFGFLDYIVDESCEIPGNDEKITQKTYDVSKLDPDNLMIIAVVFSSESTKKYSNPPEGNPFDAYYADACNGTHVVEKGNLPPRVGITNPKKGRLHIFGKEITATPRLRTILIGRTIITANADDDSKIEKVKFYIDDRLVAEFTKEPYEWMWKTPSWFRLKHTIKVVAYDDKGKSSTTELDVFAFILL
jgi:thiol-disulfide isomerase/thioredoxin